jgi:replication initiation and membrane attachment protein DnaB
MRTVQLMKKMSDASKQKPGPKRKLSDSARKRNKREANAKLNNNHCQECVRAYLSIHDCLSFLHEVMIGNQRNKTTEIVRTINMHTDLQISSCWEHIST